MLLPSELESLARRCEQLQRPAVPLADAIATAFAAHCGPEAGRLAFQALTELNLASARNLHGAHVPGWVLFGRITEIKSRNSGTHGPDYRTTLVRAGILAGRRRTKQNYVVGLGYFGATSLVAALLRVLAMRGLN